jgi:hypothetical protein
MTAPGGGAWGALINGVICGGGEGRSTKKPDPCASVFGCSSRVHMGPVLLFGAAPSRAVAVVSAEPRAYFFFLAIVSFATFFVAAAVFFAMSSSCFNGLVSSRTSWIRARALKLTSVLQN